MNNSLISPIFDFCSINSNPFLGVVYHNCLSLHLNSHAINSDDNGQFSYSNIAIYDILNSSFQSNGYSFCGSALLYDTFNISSTYKKGYMRKAKKDWNAYTYVQTCEVYANFNVEGYTFTKYLQ